MSGLPWKLSCVEEEHCYTDPNNNRTTEGRMSYVNQGKWSDFSSSTPTRRVAPSGTAMAASLDSPPNLTDNLRASPVLGRRPYSTDCFSSDEVSLSESDVFEYSHPDAWDETPSNGANGGESPQNRSGGDSDSDAESLPNRSTGDSHHSAQSPQNRSTGVDKQTQGPLSAAQIRDAAMAAINQFQGQWPQPTPMSGAAPQSAFTPMSGAAPQPAFPQMPQAQMTSAMFPLPPHWQVNPFIPGVTERGSSPVYQLKYLDGMLFVRQPRLPERVTAEQDKKLQEEFATLQFLTYAKRDSLANQLFMDPKDVTRWFHNARKRVLYREVMEQKLAASGSAKPQDNSANASDGGYSTGGASAQNASSSRVSPLHGDRPSTSQGRADHTAQPLLSPITIEIPSCSLSPVLPVVRSSPTKKPVSSVQCRDVVPYCNSILISAVNRLASGSRASNSPRVVTTTRFPSLNGPLSPSDLAAPLGDTPVSPLASCGPPCQSQAGTKRPLESPTRGVDSKRMFRDVTNKYYVD